MQVSTPCQDTLVRHKYMEQTHNLLDQDQENEQLDCLTKARCPPAEAVSRPACRAGATELLTDKQPDAHDSGAPARASAAPGGGR